MLSGSKPFSGLSLRRALDGSKNDYGKSHAPISLGRAQETAYAVLRRGGDLLGEQEQLDEREKKEKRRF